MGKRPDLCWTAAAVFALGTMLLIASCERASRTPPPEDALRVMQGIKAGYNAEDSELFCADFSDIMFTKGFTKGAYLDVIQSVKSKYGNWDSETYLGFFRGEHVWRVKLEKGTLKLILILNRQNKVTGLWFRWFAFWERLVGK